MNLYVTQFKNALPIDILISESILPRKCTRSSLVTDNVKSGSYRKGRAYERIIEESLS